MNKSKQISLGAIITVISIALMYSTSFLPTIKIFLLSLSSFLISILILESGKRIALTSFLATSILGFILVPNKLLLIPYISFLGYYGVLKYYIEGLNKVILEWIIKLVIFNLALYVNYIISVNILAQEIIFPYALGIAVVGLQILFIVYDYVFSMFIHYYNDKLRRYIK